MIYRRLSRGEMLKALQDHATFRSHDHSAVMKWDERAGTYYIIGNGMCIAVDAFEEFTGMSTMIRMSASLKMSEEKKTLDIEGSPINTLYQETVGKVGKEGFDINEFTAANPASALAPYYIMRNLAWGLDLGQLQTLRGKLDASLDGNKYVKQLEELIARKEAVQVGKTAPDFTLPDPDGKPVSLKDFRGKYVLVSFWAGWCPDCRRENPFIVEAYNKYKDKNFTVLGVSIDRNRETWLNTVEQQGLVWTQVSNLKYWQSDVIELYAIRWVPTGILLDPDGKILNISLNEDELVKNLASVFE